ncbi:MAG TPA: crossover junction endodeoxyribonuclease RuvC [Vicinamibacterales bacterium]|nr:crossover junction endodeoxyribonuclease RuvC [Vicinamibacterales bacterium]
MRIVGIDPGSERTGYGCVETDGRHHRLVTCGAITAAAGDAFPARLARIHRELVALLAKTRPDCVAVESVFHAVNARSALTLGHARGVALLAAVEAGCTIVEYTPAEVKRAVVGYGRAEKRQVQQMIKLLLGLAQAPTPYDASDALAVAICHVHSGVFKADLKTRLYDGAAKSGGAALQTRPGQARLPKSWRQYRPPAQG